MSVTLTQALLDDVSPHMSSIYSFLGFPANPPSALLQRNEKAADYSVHSIDCSTKALLEAVYTPWSPSS